MNKQMIGLSELNENLIYCDAAIISSALFTSLHNHELFAAVDYGVNLTLIRIDD